ncbi:hypothetical protein [Luteimonas fraxinea]|uniref:Uncharacterized protein n=1 Tax=Luteimonas fraxinea TaxID=2901869 RepID=A0ABS8UET2_9GAMM|nr:hypothetical protein [Luteimonas fraxinea]MCD9097030.1 hypothetical protein [Luteimonas fraxinea]
MAAGFEYFDYQSPGAPVLHGAAGRLIALLDWALVSKGGWEKAFTGTNLAAYRSATGNRMFYRVDDTQATYSRVRGQRGMTGISAGLTGQFPSNAQAGNINLFGVRKAFDTGPASDFQRYWGVRTNRYLVLFIESVSQLDTEQQTGRTARNWIVIGDLPSMAEADSYCSVVCGTPNTDNAYVDWRQYSMYIQAIAPDVSYSIGAAGAAISGSPNGSVVSPLCGVHWPFGQNAASYPSLLVQSDRMYFQPLLLGCGPSATAANQGAYPRALVANVSALYGGCADGVPLPTLPATDLVPLTVGSRQFLPILYTANFAGGYTGEACLLEMTDTDGAL